jgi:hypothetical protein
MVEDLTRAGKENERPVKLKLDGPTAVESGAVHRIPPGNVDLEVGHLRVIEPQLGTADPAASSDF